MFLIRCMVALAVVLSLVGVLQAQGGPAASQPAVKLTPAEEYRLVTDQLARIANPAEGVPLLERFIDEHPGSPMLDSAKAELGRWKDRAAKGLVRFGPTSWLPKAEVDAKNTQADALLAQAGGEEPPKAVLTLTKAAGIHPYRADIHFKKLEILLRANREKEAVGPMAAIRAFDPNNAAVINNIGVLSARQKQWQPAFEMLLLAAGKSPDTDAIWDNFDQAFTMAREAGLMASSATSVDSQMRGMVARVHKAGNHVGQTRWGNSWITEADYATYLRDNSRAAVGTANLAGQIVQLRNQGAALERQKADIARRNPENGPAVQQQLAKLDAQIKDITTRLDALEKQVDPRGNSHEPTHSGKLVLLNLDGSELQSLEGKPADTTGPGGGERPKPPGGGLFGN